LFLATPNSATLTIKKKENLHRQRGRYFVPVQSLPQGMLPIFSLAL
jgi:hypothetical protein